MIGSVVPGVGTAIGAGVGALAGGIAGYFSGTDDVEIDGSQFKDPNAASNHAALDRQMRDIKRKSAPLAGKTQIGQNGYITAPRLGAADVIRSQTLGPAAQIQGSQVGPTHLAGQVGMNLGEQAQMRTGQQSLIQALQQRATGAAPSLAELQMKRATDRGLAQQVALAASARGGNLAQTQRNLMQNQAQMNQQAAAESAALRMQEQQSAEQALGNALQGARQQDIGLAATQAELAQQTTLANQGALNQNAQMQAQLSQQAQMANQSATNQYGLAQAELAQQAALANQGANNQFALTQGQMDLSAAQGNQGVTVTQAQMNQQVSLANAAAQQQRQAQVDQLTAQYVAMGLALDQAQFQAQMDLAKLNAGVEMNNNQQSTQQFGAIMQGMGGLGAGVATAFKK
jgi:hypothetical protein